MQELRGLAQEMQAPDRKFAHFCRAGVDKVAECNSYKISNLATGTAIPVAILCLKFNTIAIKLN